MAIVACFVVAGLAYSFLATEWFVAESVLTPPEKKGGVPTAGLGQLSGLASLAGITVGAAGSQEAVAVLKSRNFARDFITDFKLLPVLLASRWDAKTGQWKKSTFGETPDIRDGVTYFIESVRMVNEDKKAGLVTLAIRWKDPDVAASWANTLVKRLNDRMRDTAVAEANRNIEYLQQEMVATNLLSLQQSVGRVLEAEMQKLMLARGNDEFAFKVVDQATPPKEPSWPKWLLVTLVAFIAGCVVSALVIVVRYARSMKLFDRRV